MKNTQLGNKYKEEREVLIEKIGKLEQKCNQQTEVIDKSDQRIKHLGEQKKKMEEDFKVLQGQLESAKKTAREHSHLRPKVEAVEKDMQEVQSKYYDILQKFEKEKSKNDRLSEEVETLKRKYDRDITQINSDSLSLERIKSLEVRRFF